MGGHLTRTLIHWWLDWHVIPPGIAPKPLPHISNANAISEGTFIAHQNNLTRSTADQHKQHSHSIFRDWIIVTFYMDTSSIEVCTQFFGRRLILMQLFYHEIGRSVECKDCFNLRLDELQPEKPSIGAKSTSERSVFTNSWLRYNYTV